MKKRRKKSLYIIFDESDNKDIKNIIDSMTIKKDNINIKMSPTTKTLDYSDLFNQLNVNNEK